MLINCPECNHKVSDKAFSYPECGYPISQSSIPTHRESDAATELKPKRIRKNTRSCLMALEVFKSSPETDNTLMQLIRLVDDRPLKHASKELIVSLFNQMSKYALQNDYIDKNYAQFKNRPLRICFQSNRSIRKLIIKYRL